MKVIIALLILAAVAVYAEEEMEYHPQAVLHYLEMEDQEMARKVRRHIKMDMPSGRPNATFQPSFRPSNMPISLPPEVKFCLGGAFVCHHKAGDDACQHLKCIKYTGQCLHCVAGVRLSDVPDNVKKCLPIIPCCLLGSETCEEKLCCFVRFGECAKKLGDKE